MHFTRSKLNDYKAAGVLPITVNSGQPYVLLGAESCRTGPEGKFWKVMWRDFGGQREAIDNDSMDTAAREFSEETLGLFGGCNVNVNCVLQSTQYMVCQLQNKSHNFPVVHQLKKGEYHMFICHTPFIEPVMFHLAMQQNQLSKAIAGAEKSNFAWVRLPELLSAVAHCSRQYHFCSRQRLWSKSHQPEGSHRLQLHPCFASSLRLAQAAGLEAFVSGLLQPRSPSGLPHLNVDTPQPPPSARESQALPTASLSLASRHESQDDAQAASAITLPGLACAATAAACGCSRCESTAEGDGCSPGKVSPGPTGITPDHMTYWLMQPDVAELLVSSSCTSGMVTGTTDFRVEGDGSAAQQEAVGGGREEGSDFQPAEAEAGVLTAHSNLEMGEGGPGLRVCTEQPQDAGGNATSTQHHPWPVQERVRPGAQESESDVLDYRPRGAHGAKKKRMRS